MTSANVKPTAPPASAGYREELARLIRARSKPVEDLVFDDLIKDNKWFPTDPDRATTVRKLAHQVVQALTRPTITVLLLVLLLLMPAPASAYQPVFDSAPLPGVDGALAPLDSWAGPAYCDDRKMLEFLVKAESYSQEREAQIAILQIILLESQQRGISVCALSRFSNFLAPYPYRLAHPGSWHDRQWQNTEAWAWELAGDVLEGAHIDRTRGARHFDGADHEGEAIIWQSGQIRFYR